VQTNGGKPSGLLQTKNVGAEFNSALRGKGWRQAPPLREINNVTGGSPVLTEGVGETLMVSRKKMGGDKPLPYENKVIKK